MTTAELIEYLKAQPPDRPVLAFDSVTGTWRDVDPRTLMVHRAKTGEYRHYLYELTRKNTLAVVAIR